MGTVMTGLFNGMLGGVMNSPEVQAEMGKKILEGINKIRI